MRDDDDLGVFVMSEDVMRTTNAGKHITLLCQASDDLSAGGEHSEKVLLTCAM